MLSYSKVTSTSARPTHDIFVLQYSDGTEIETTWNHPFYIQDKGWVEVKDLEVGDLSLTSRDTVLEITGIRMKPAPQTVYNIHLDKDHTYFVTDSDVLVHNYSFWEKFGKGAGSVIGIGLTIYEFHQAGETAEDAYDGMEGMSAAKRNFYEALERGDMKAAQEYLEKIKPSGLKGVEKAGELAVDGAQLPGTPGGQPIVRPSIEGTFNSLATRAAKKIVKESVPWFWDQATKEEKKSSPPEVPSKERSREHPWVKPRSTIQQPPVWEEYLLYQLLVPAEEKSQ